MHLNSRVLFESENVHEADWFFEELKREYAPAANNQN
jgi:hypothetical protein